MQTIFASLFQGMPMETSTASTPAADANSGGFLSLVVGSGQQLVAVTASQQQPLSSDPADLVSKLNRIHQSLTQLLGETEHGLSEEDQIAFDGLLEDLANLVVQLEPEARSKVTSDLRSLFDQFSEMSEVAGSLPDLLEKTELVSAFNTANELIPNVQKSAPLLQVVQQVTGVIRVALKEISTERPVQKFSVVSAMNSLAAVGPQAEQAVTQISRAAPAAADLSPVAPSAGPVVASTIASILSPASQVAPAMLGEQNTSMFGAELFQGSSETIVLPDAFGESTTLPEVGKSVLEKFVGMVTAQDRLAKPVPALDSLPVRDPIGIVDLVRSASEIEMVEHSRPQSETQMRARDTLSSRFATMLVNQVRAVDFQEGTTRFELTPRGLGNVEVEMQTNSDGTLSVVVRAENAHVLNSLREEHDLLAQIIANNEGASFEFEQFSEDRSQGGFNGSSDDLLDNADSDEPVDKRAEQSTIGGGQLDLMT